MSDLRGNLIVGAKEKARALGERFRQKFVTHFDRFSQRTPALEKVLKTVSVLAIPTILVTGVLVSDFVWIWFSSRQKPSLSPPAAPRQIVKQEIPRLRPWTAYEDVIRANPFCPGCPVPRIEVTQIQVIRNCDRGTKLNGRPKVIGTVVLSERHYSIAILEDGGETTAVSEGETYKTFGEVFEIRRDRVCFIDKSMRISFAELQDELMKFGRSGTPTTSGAVADSGSLADVEDRVVGRNDLNAALNDPDLLKQAASRIEKDEEGNVVGVRILSFQPGTFFEKVGIRYGDVISEINGQPFSIMEASKLYANATSLDSLELTVKRQGKVVRLKFRVGN